MDDTIQILVFVVTIIVFIVSAVMQQKKKPDAPKSSNFETIVESFFGIPQENSQVQREEIRTDYFQSEYTERDAVQNDSFKVRKEKMVDLVNTEGVNAIADPVEESHVDDVVTPFDARQAIIYSEILNRKYF